MESAVIDIEIRSAVGSSANRRTRKEGKIPSVVYSHGESSTPVSIGERQFIQIARQSKSSQIFTLKSADKRFDGRSAVVKEVQKDHLKGLILHVDFQAIRDDEEITVRVPLRMVGEAPGVKIDGGILTVVSHEISIRCFPKLIPAQVDVDVSTLRLGNSIHAEQLVLTKGVKLAGNPGETIVSVVAVRAVVEEETTTTAAATTDATAAAAAPGAAGAAPAEGEKAAAAAPAKDAKKDKK